MGAAMPQALAGLHPMKINRQIVEYRGLILIIMLKTRLMADQIEEFLSSFLFFLE